MNDPVYARLKLPESATLDVSAVMYDYDRPSDTITVHLFGRGHPAVILHSGGYVDLLLDPTTEDVVGFQIEGYLAHVVYQDPRFLSLADLAGIDAAEIDRIRQTIAPDRRRRAGVALLEDLLRASA
ncbi:MAG TPA: hypothetical protein VFW96_15830 [Thermomicrobiales bacterium]|nr:hypothetical protein [Thermomicrobiales bacterium]